MIDVPLAIGVVSVSLAILVGGAQFLYAHIYKSKIDRLSLNYRRKDGSVRRFKDVPINNRSLIAELKSITEEFEAPRLKKLYFFEEIAQEIGVGGIDDTGIFDPYKEKTTITDPYMDEVKDKEGSIFDRSSSSPIQMPSPLEEWEIFEQPAESNEQALNRELTVVRNRICEIYKSEDVGVRLIVPDPDDSNVFYDLRYEVPSEKFQRTFRKIEDYIMRLFTFLQEHKKEVINQTERAIDAIEEILDAACDVVSEALPVLAEEMKNRDNVVYHKYLKKEFEFYRRASAGKIEKMDILLRIEKLKRTFLDAEQLDALANAPKEITCLALLLSAHHGTLFTTKVDTRITVFLKRR